MVTPHYELWWLNKSQHQIWKCVSWVCMDAMIGLLQQNCWRFAKKAVLSGEHLKWPASESPSSGTGLACLLSFSPAPTFFHGTVLQRDIMGANICANIYTKNVEYIIEKQPMGPNAAPDVLIRSSPLLDLQMFMGRIWNQQDERKTRQATCAFVWRKCLNDF